MRWSIIRLIWFREVRDQLRDRRTVFMMAVLPILLYPLVGIGLIQFAAGFNKKRSVLGVVGAEHLPSASATSAGLSPLPATAWLPLAFFVFPSSFSASIFLIALATGFPVTVLTWSGVAGVNSAYYDIARTLGANQRFLVLKVAIPAAMPHVFVGLFMGLGNSFAVLVVAEMLGVKAGLGWYLQWAQGWAAYANMYAALLLMAFLCSGLITLLFRLRDRLLSWQKGLVRW